MTSTELAVIDNGEVEPLSEGKAKQLDKRIRAASTRFANEGDKLLDLLEEAATGQIHVALGFTSWTAYVKEACDFKVSDREERKALVSIMSGKGMSQRAIAGTLGVSQKTVDRDLDGESFDSDKVTSLTGQEVPRNKPKKAKDDNVIDAEVIDIEEERKPADVVTEFEQPVLDLVNDVQAMKDIIAVETETELFPKARKRIAQRFVKRLTTAIADLEAVVAELTEDVAETE